ncbi:MULTISPECIES: GNAT family N-acetyltransferase [Streptomyces]|uniref:GNAT family N-acetyltransferase n=1 Tax=Streptomyces sudanensis TaxID=436397 RepID=A0ABY4TFX7_9ACTN|nr:MULTISPECIES: GNAT family N-acetyltransferase [Streptomyces]URN17366.1 GNAT family N-acetyltransferase [Streptomyces sudanensis]
MTTTIGIRHHNDLGPVRATLLSVYADVRAELLHLPNYTVDAFTERLDRHAGEAGWEAVIGYDSGEPIGYVYANTILDGDRWWRRVSPPPPKGYTERPAVALKEIGVRPPWRGTGAALKLHEALLSHREEPYATLMVNPAAGEGKVLRLYERWGYRSIGSSRPSPGSPELTVMVRER